MDGQTMNQAVKLSSILAGVSFVAMSAFAGPVLAASGPGPYQNTTSAVPVTNDTDYDFLVVEDYSVSGDFTNNGNIGGGILENKVGIELKEVDGVTLIDGDLINNAVVTANDSGLDATATAVLVWSGADISGSIVNNGDIAAYATAVDATTPVASAKGVVQSATVTGSETVSLFNEGEIWAGASSTASGNGAEANANGVSQILTATEAANLSVDNMNLIEAKASTSPGNFSKANAKGVYQKGEANVVTADVRNEGVIRASSSGSSMPTATAVEQSGKGLIVDLAVSNLGEIEAYGEAWDATVIKQKAEGSNEELFDQADLYVENDGTIAAHAKGGTAEAVSQVAEYGHDIINITLINRSLIEARSERSVVSEGRLDLGTDASAVEQTGNVAKDADVRLYNEDTIAAISRLETRSPGFTFSRVYSQSIYQDASGYEDATACIWNLGKISTVGDAFAGGNGVTYDGAVTALVDAFATGIEQWVDYGGARSGTVDNSSSLSVIDVHLTAEAIGSKRVETDARGVAIQQIASDSTKFIETLNLGTIEASVSAVARTTAGADLTDNGNASAQAFANGLNQMYLDNGQTTMRLDNSGDLVATAFAEADGYDDGAMAVGRGYYAYNILNAFSKKNSLNLDFENYEEGVISGTAGATANTDAKALAAGVWIEVGEDAYIEGNGLNAGLISASAYAEGTEGYADAFGMVLISDVARASTMTNTGVIEALARGVNPSATAVAVASKGRIVGPEVVDEPEAVIRNSGGVIVAGIIAGPAPLAVEGPEGETILRGNAFNLTGFTSVSRDITFDDITYGAAPGATVVNLRGGEAGSAGKAFVETNDAVSDEVADAFADAASYGYVFGNILLTEDDRIEVTDGVTLFDGVINTDKMIMGNGDPEPVEYDAELTINNGGTLVMLQNNNEGASRGFVNELNIGNNGSGEPRALTSGTLAYELTSSTESGKYSQIFVNRADLENGKFLAVYQAGMYADKLIYENIIDAQDLDEVAPTGLEGDAPGLYGKFASVEDNSVLLETKALYEYLDETDNVGQNVDLVTTRTGFGDVAGLTRNQRATGDGIEKVYDPAKMPKGAFSDLVASMFTVSDEKSYNDFLDQLSGAEYAQQLQSVLWSTRALNRVITERMECTDGSTGGTQTSSAKLGDTTVMPTADAPMQSTGCFEPGEASVWMRGFGQWTALDGDDEAPGLDETQYGILFGADYSFDENWFAGIAGGYFNANGDFENWGGRSGGSSEYDGLQIAAYGGYDNSSYYLRGVLAYGNYDGSVDRDIDTTGFVQGRGVTGSLSGDPSSDVLSFYGETGYRFAVGGAGNITPFAGLSLASATLEGFTEDDEDGTGAALKVDDSDADSVASVLGLRLDADMAMSSGVFTPSVSVAWMHEFGDTEQTVDASFAEAPGSDFSVIGSEVARDSVLVDAGANFSMDDTFDLGLFYNGQFNENYSSNAVSARLGYRF